MKARIAILLFFASVIVLLMGRFAMGGDGNGRIGSAIVVVGAIACLLAGVAMVRTTDRQPSRGWWLVFLGLWAIVIVVHGWMALFGSQ